ncbi:MAG: sulfotransferase, partial [Rubrobacter sp.]|nr:sulfotransferase [Rubrobacter sp.]
MQGRVRRRVAGKKTGKTVAPEALDRARSAPRLTEPSGASATIFFVVGYQKSGTTWLMKMLDAHPEILCQGEGRPFGRNWRQEHLKRRRGSYPPTSLYNAMLSAEDLRYWIERSVWSRGDDTDEHLTNLTGLAVEYFLTQRLAKTGKKLVGDKTVLLDPETIREISAIYPQAKVIHIIRDGRDAAISTMHQKWNGAEDRGGSIKTTPDQIAKRESYRKDPQSLMETDEGIFPEGWISKSAARWRARVARTVHDGPALLGENYAEVRYEDLLANPEGELGRLVGFLGADATQEVVGQSVG